MSYSKCQKGLHIATQSFIFAAKNCTACRSARSKYNAHAVNWARLQPTTSINVHWK